MIGSPNMYAFLLLIPFLLIPILFLKRVREDRLNQTKTIPKESSPSQMSLKEQSFFRKLYGASAESPQIYSLEGPLRIEYVRASVHIGSKLTVPDRAFIGSQEIIFKNHFVFTMKEDEINRADAVFMSNNKAALISVEGKLFLTRETMDRYRLQGGEVDQDAVIVEEIYEEASLMQKLFLGHLSTWPGAALGILFSLLITLSVVLIGFGVPKLFQYIGKVSEYRREQEEIQRHLAFDPVVYNSLKDFIASEPEKGDEIALESVRFVPVLDQQTISVMSLLIPSDTLYKEPDYSGIISRLKLYEQLDNSPLADIHRENYPRENQSRLQKRVEGWENWLNTDQASEVVRVFSETPSFQNFRKLLENCKGNYSPEMWRAYRHFIDEEQDLFQAELSRRLEDAGGPDSVILSRDGTYSDFDLDYDFGSFQSGFFDYQHRHSARTDDFIQMLSRLKQKTEQVKNQSAVSGIIRDEPYRQEGHLNIRLDIMDTPGISFAPDSPDPIKGSL